MTLEPQGELFIWAKNADDATNDSKNVIWNSREQTLGDDSDILELYDSNGKVVHRYSTV